MTKKIIGIGFNKTGTTTLSACLKKLNFSVPVDTADLLLDYEFKNKDYDKLFDILSRYDGFADFPWPFLYKEIDRNFQNVYYVLTVRESTDKWIQSQKKHLAAKGPIPSTLLYYGFYSPNENENDFRELYENHNENVRKYFSGCENFLELCWDSGDGWSEICNFLNVNVPDVTLPHQNARFMSETELQLKTHIAEARICMISRNFDRALIQYDLAKSIASDAQYILRLERDILMYNSMWDEALEIALKVHVQDLHTINDYIQIGALYHHLNQFSEAETAFLRATEINFPKKEALAWTHLGWCYISMNQFVDAEQALRLSIDIDPRNAFTHQVLDVALVSLNRPLEAAASAVRASELTPEDKDIQNHLLFIASLVDHI